MTLTELKYVIAVAREHHFGRAAESCGVSQPSLSVAIRKLEEELGVKLFRRSKYCIKLTEEGLYLKRRAEEILALAEDTAQSLCNKDKDIAGVISIGCTETHSMDEFASRMAEFRKLHPDVSYKVYTINADGVKENIEKGIIELGLITEPVDTSRFETFHLEGKERWGALVKVDDPLAGKEFVYPEDLADKPLIVPIRSEVQYLLESWLGKAFDDLDITARYNLGRNIAVMVSRGVGVGICFDLFSSYEGLKFIPMIPPLMTGSVVCWKKDQLFSTVTRSFIEFLRNAQA